jgi:hypothetical protein
MSAPRRSSPRAPSCSARLVTRQVARTRGNAAIASLARGNPAQAVDIAREAVMLARAAGSAWTLAYTQYTLGWANRFSGDADVSLRCALDSAALFEAVDDQRGRAFALVLLATLRTDAGRATEVLGPLRESVAIFAALDDNWGILTLPSHVVAAYAELGEFARAARLLGAEGLRERIGAELLPFLQQTQDRGAALARAHLGDHAFEAAVADGRKLSRALDDHRDARTGRERGRARANHR